MQLALPPLTTTFPASAHHPLSPSSLPTSPASSSSLLPASIPTRPSPYPARPLLRLTAHARKRQIITTTTRIPPQTTLLTETPLYVLPDSSPVSSLPPHIIHRLRRLPNRHRLWSHPASERPDDHIAGVWETNCFASNNTTAVFEQISRLSHDCAPNSNLVLYEDARGVLCKVKVVAKRELREGEEVTVDLLEGDCGSVEERRLELARRWGFWCVCLRCVAESGGQVG